MKNEIYDSFEKIKTTESKKEHIFYEIQRNYDKKGYLSNKRLHFFKQRFDRFVPLIAFCLILVLGFSFYGVSSGLFTGTPYKSTGEMLAEAGYADEAKVVTEDSASTAETSSADEKSADAKSVSSDIPETTAYAAELTDANIYAPMDIGYTLYKVNDIPNDGLVLWDEITAVSTVPSTVSLEGYTLESDTLTLNFNEALQQIQNSSATTAFVCGITKTYSEFYPDADEVVINSAGKPISFEGEPIDTSEFMSVEIDITDTITVKYKDG